MTHDPFVPPAGPAPLGGTTPPVGGPVPNYTYGQPLYQLPPLHSTSALGVAAMVLASVWTAAQVVVLLLAPRGADALREAGEAGLTAFDSEFTAYDGVGLLAIAIQLATYVVVSVWLYQSRSTAIAANPKFVHERSRVWTWLGWLVPVVSLWFPYQVVRDVRRATSPGPVSGIGAWWAAWLVFLSASNVAGRLVDGRAPGTAVGAAEVLVPIETVSTVAMIVALVLWVRIIRDVTRAQDERIAAAQREPMS
jgi:hypothetical protein